MRAWLQLHRHDEQLGEVGGERLVESEQLGEVGGGRLEVEESEELQLLAV